MSRIFILFFSLFLLSSCGSNEEIPEGVLNPEKMQAVLWDVINADAYTKEFISKDSAKDAVKENLNLQQQIFAIHKVSKEAFYKSFDYYKTNTSAFKQILDSMTTQAERKNNEKIRPTNLSPE